MTAPPAPRALVVLAFAAVYLIWGSTYLGIRVAVETLPPFTMAGARFVIAGGLLLAWAAPRAGTLGTAAQWRAGVITGLLLLLVGNGLVSWAEQRVASSVAALVIAITPLWMVLLDWMAPGGRRPGFLTTAGLVAGLAGVAWLADPFNADGLARTDPWRVAALVIACLSWSAGSIWSRRQPAAAVPFLGAAQQMLGGGAALLLAGFALGEWTRWDPAATSLHSWIAFGYLTIAGSLVAFTAYVFLLRASTPARVSTYAYVNPLVAVLLGWLVGGEPVGPRLLAGAALIIGAVALITSAPGRPR